MHTLVVRSVSNYVYLSFYFIHFENNISVKFIDPLYLQSPRLHCSIANTFGYKVVEARAGEA